MSPPLPRASLRLLATTDVHMHLSGWDPLTDLDTPDCGMDRLATRIRAEQASAAGATVLLENGDGLQGTPLGDTCADLGAAHPWPDILNALEYDAVGLGNHDFDFGVPALEAVLSRIACPVLCTNIRPDLLRYVHPHKVIEKAVECSDGTVQTLKIGLTSALPPQTGVWNRRWFDTSGVFVPGVESVRASVSHLRHTGADLVFVLCHSGLTDGPDKLGENFAAALAASVDGIDGMVLGHTHLQFPGDAHAGFKGTDMDRGTVHDVPCVMPAHAGREVGVIDLDLERGAEGWRVHDHDVRRIGISPTDPVAPDIDAIVSPHVQATRDALGSRIGTAHADLNTWFSMLRPCMTEDLLARAMRTTIKDAVKETDLAQLPVLASVAPSALGGRAGPRNFVDIPAGPFLERHAAMMCPYPNTIWALVLRGYQISDWLDRSLSYFAPAGTHGPLVDPQAPAFNFDALHGLETTVDPIKPSRFDALGNRTLGNSSRVQQVTHDGRPIDMNDRFVVAMTSFRAAGGGNFPGADGDAQVIRTQIELKAALRNVVGQAVNGVSPEPPAWRFAPGLNVTRTIETAPKAEEALDQISAFAPRPLGLTDSGFLRVEVTL